MVISVPLSCILNLGSGLLINGLCSHYQMKEEEKRMQQQEEVIRHSIRRELERNNKHERQRKRSRSDAFSDDNEIFNSCLRAERKRKLMVQKMSSSELFEENHPMIISKSTASSLGDTLEGDDCDDDLGDEMKFINS